MPHDLRDVVVDFMRSLHERTELPLSRLIVWLGISRPKFYDWVARYGKVNEHNALIPRFSGHRSGNLSSPLETKPGAFELHSG